MQVKTYLTRNFATFVPSELRQPLTKGFKNSKHHFYYTKKCRAGVSEYNSHYVSHSPMFLLNSRYK